MNTLNFPGNKLRHQEEAAERKKISDAMTPAQRIAHLDEHGFMATKERARNQKKLAKKNQIAIIGLTPVEV